MDAVKILVGAFSLLAIAAPLAADEKKAPPVRDERRVFQRGLTSWQALKQLNIVMQTTDYSCGAATLATIVRYYWGDEVNEKFFLDAVVKSLSKEELADRVENGLSMTDLRDAAVKRGYPAVMGKRELEELKEVKVPVIVRIIAEGHEHFVVLRGVTDDYAFLADPIRGNLRVPLYKFSEQWKDRALLVVAKLGSDLMDDSPLLVSPQERDVRFPEQHHVRRTLTLPVRPPTSPFAR